MNTSSHGLAEIFARNYAKQKLKSANSAAGHRTQFRVASDYSASLASRVRRRWWIATGFLLVLLLLGGIALVGFFSSRRIIRLANGTEVISVSADFGTNHY